MSSLLSPNTTSVPVMFWATLRYLGLGINEGWAVVKTVAVWGYAMFVWIPVSVRDPSSAHIPLGSFFLTGIGFALSGSFLVVNIYPRLCTSSYFDFSDALTLSPLSCR
jgi:hypothetical protein